MSKWRAIRFGISPRSSSKWRKTVMSTVIQSVARNPELNQKDRVSKCFAFAGFLLKSKWRAIIFGIYPYVEMTCDSFRDFSSFFVEMTKNRNEYRHSERSEESRHELERPSKQVLCICGISPKVEMTCDYIRDFSLRRNDVRFVSVFLLVFRRNDEKP